jgi:hypothetical protein
MAHRLVIDYYEDGSVSVVRFPYPHRTITMQLEIGQDAYYDMEEEWQHPNPDSMLYDRAEYYVES